VLTRVVPVDAELAVLPVPACETVPVRFEDEPVVPVRFDDAVPVALAAIREDGDERVVRGGEPPELRAVDTVVVCCADDIVRGRDPDMMEMLVGAAELTVAVLGREYPDPTVAVLGLE